MKISKFRIEDHPNFKLSADYDKTKRLAIKKCYDLKKKIAEINEQTGGTKLEANEYDEDVQKIQRPVEVWMHKPIRADDKVSSENGEEDEFFF